MTPRERILTILCGRQPDQVPWFGDLDYWAAGRIGRGEVPDNFVQNQAYLDWHQDLGVGFYLQSNFPFKTYYQNLKIKEWWEGTKHYTEFITPKGKLRSCWQWLTDSFTIAPVEHLIKCARDLPILLFLYENIVYELDYSFTLLRLEQVGDIGIVVCYTPKSPFMQLAALDAGIENLTFIIQEAPDEFEATLQTMELTLEKALRITIESPADVLMIPENLSSEVVGVKFFEKYMRGVQEKWAKQIADAGKWSLIHMDGTLKGLLRQECSVGVTALEGLTPAPVGDLEIEKWADYGKDSKTIFWGGIPGCYFTSVVSDKEFERHVKHVLSVMRTEPRYVLGVADQVPPDVLEYRVRRVRELVEEYGNYLPHRKERG